MTMDRTRLSGAVLLIGSVLAITGYAAANAFTGYGGDAHFTSPAWIPLYGIALAGDLLAVVGLPAILAAHGGRAYWLTTVGYVGTLLAIMMLNVGEGTVEAFVKPYLVSHGGIPSSSPAGFEAYLDVALLILVVGLISLGAAVIRGRVFPWWAGALLILSVPLSLVPLPGLLTEIGDDAAFLALAVMGGMVAFRGSRWWGAAGEDLARTPQPSA